MSGKLILLTGATGFLGAALAEQLLQAGFRVRAPVRHRNGLPTGVESVPFDGLDKPVHWTPLLSGVDAIVHAAAIAHIGPSVPEDLYRRVNTEATLDLARAAEGRVGRMIFISSIRAQSGAVARTLLDESLAPMPTEAYGRSKLAAEEALSKLNLMSASLRPPVIYGAGVKANMAALLRLARTRFPLPLGGLTAPRSIVSTENISSAVIHMLNKPVPLTGPYIVADPRPTSIAAMLRVMRLAMGRSPLVFPFPESLIGAALTLVGARRTWQTLAGPLAVNPQKLLSSGWHPAHEASDDGIARWVRADRAERGY